MSKRVSKRKQKRLSPVETRKQMLIDRKFKQDRRALLGVLLPVLGLLAVLLSYGAYSEMWRKPREPIARVNGEAVTAAQFTDRVNWDRLQLINSLDNLRGMIQTSDASFLGNMAAQQRTSLVQTTVDTLVDETIIRQEAESRGITVSDRDVRNYVISNTLRTILLATPEPDPVEEEAAAAAEADADAEVAADAGDEAAGDEAASETGDEAAAAAEDSETETDAATGDDAVDADATEDPADAEAGETDGDDTDTSSSSDKPTDPDDVSDEDFDNAVENYLVAQFTTAGITKQDYLEIVRQAVYRERLNKALGEEIETTAPQSELDYLLFRDKATADAAAAALAGGDSWEEIVATYGPRDAETEDDADAETEDDADAEGAEVEGEAGAATEDDAAADEASDTATGDDADSEDAAGTADEEASSEEAAAEDEGSADDEAADEATDGATGDDEAASEDAAADSEATAEDGSVAEDEADAEATAAPTALPTPEPEPYAFERGDLRWYTRAAAIERLGLSDENADTVLALEPGAVSESIQNSRGYIIVKAEDVDSAHALDATELKDKRAAAVDTWLEEAKKTADIQRFAYDKLTPPEPEWFLTAFDQITGAQSAQPTIDVSSIGNTQPEVQFDQAPADGAAPAPDEGGADAPADGADDAGAEDAGAGDAGSGDAGGEDSAP